MPVAQQHAQPLPQPPATGRPHAPAPAGSAASPVVANTGQQPPRTHVTVGTGRRRVSVGHGPALVEDGVTGRTAEFVDGHGGPPPAAYAMTAPTPRPRVYGWANA